MPGRPRKQKKALAKFEDALRSLSELVWNTAPRWVFAGPATDDPRSEAWNRIRLAIFDCEEAVEKLFEFYDAQLAKTAANKAAMAGDAEPESSARST